MIYSLSVAIIGTPFGPADIFGLTWNATMARIYLFHHVATNPGYVPQSAMVPVWLDRP